MALVKSNFPAFPTFPRLFDDFFTRDLFDFNNLASQAGTSGGDAGGTAGCRGGRRGGASFPGDRDIRPA